MTDQLGRVDPVSRGVDPAWHRVDPAAPVAAPDDTPSRSSAAEAGSEPTSVALMRPRVSPRESAPIHRRAPRGLAEALRGLEQRLAPATALAAVQAVWGEVAGEALSAAAQPTGERDGTLTLTCVAAVWAQELQLMGPDLATRINARVGRSVVQDVRCVVGS